MKTQLMAEDDGLQAVPGIYSHDLEPRVYEGGFKTWECAEDLSNYLKKNHWIEDRGGKDITIIEVSRHHFLPRYVISFRNIQ